MNVTCRSVVKRLFLMVFFLVVQARNSNAQETAYVHSSSWNSLILVATVNAHQYATLETHFRRTDFLENWEQIIIRPAWHYTPEENRDLALGYSFIRNHPFSVFSNPVNTREHNIWQQLIIKQSFNKIKLKHRFRFEERFKNKVVSDSTGRFTVRGSTYGSRFRYRFVFNLTLKAFKSRNAIYLTIFNEVFFNLDDGILPGKLNQNWLYAGLGYAFDPRLKLSIGYHNSYSKKNETTRITNHILQTTIHYKIH